MTSLSSALGLFADVEEGVDGQLRGEDDRRIVENRQVLCPEFPAGERFYPKERTVVDRQLILLDQVVVRRSGAGRGGLLGDQNLLYSHFLLH